ncbi:hypothetical protein BDQ17DRAFT_302397 [Cyathus striatus]|nr:hypothetical protein BDQ17DRAFT_302397 [Cyathus striatus]
MANFAQRLQADIQHATSATTSNPSFQNMQSRPAAIPSTAIKSSNNLVAPRLVSPNNLATSSINLGPSSTTPVITVPPAPSTPGTSFASGSTAFSSSVADLSRMPDPTLLSTQLNPSRTPAQADKRHLARDILRALKRPLVSDSFERESKRHASESRVLTERNNDEIKEISNSVGEPAIAATTTSEMDLSNSVPTLLNDAQRTESVVTQPQPSSIATSIHATLSVQKSSIPPANVVNEAMSSQLSPSPRLSSTTLESNEKKSQSHEVLTTHDVPGAPQPHDVIVIEDSPSGSSGSPEDLNANDISDTAIEYHQAIQRPMSPEIPVPSPNIKGNNTFSTLSPPSVEPSLPKESDGTNPPMPADPVLKETAKRRKLVPYVLVPPPPEYARRHKEWVGRSSSMLKLDSRTQVKGVDDRNTAIDFQVEALPPFTYDESEREAVRVSCTRLRESPCKWIGCGIVLNSAQGLIVHLKAEHIPLSSASSPFTCFWKGCGHRCAEDRTSLGHVERHALASLLCAYEGCNESFRGPRQLVKHNELHRYSSLKPAVDLKPIKTSKSLPTCPGVIPVTMIETAAINVPSLSESRHAALAPLVLKNISGPVHLKTERYNTIRKPLRASKFGKNEEEDGSDNYELLITGASSKHYASILSSPAKIRGQIASIHSEDVTQMAHDGLVLWGPPTEKESPPATPRLVSGFSNELGSDDADEEVRPEEFDNLELKRWDPLPDSISTSRPDTGSSEEEVVESMLAVE